jgi:hypothetical protein
MPSPFLRVVTFLERERKASRYFPQAQCYNWGLRSRTTKKIRNQQCYCLERSNKRRKRIITYSVALQSLKDLCRLTYMRFLELFRHMVGLPGRVISPSQGLYLHRTTQNRKTRTNIHALSGIRVYSLRILWAGYYDGMGT